jgi:TetR/AcrR family transcriptional repressor of nem operon
MARTKEFDPDVALDAAMELFWSRGYEATSTADLVEHLGIARASLYGTFGSKHELYLAAFDRYLRDRDPALLDLLSQPGPALPGVRAVVETYVRETVDDQRLRGCFVVNAAVELMAADTLVASRVRSSWDTIEVGLTSALLRARAQGELPRSADPRALARFLLVFLQGVRVMGHDGTADPDRLWDAARQALSILG